MMEERSAAHDTGVAITGASENADKIGIYGWRKRGLYLLILLLFITLLVNFALTAWILRVMWFSTEGMGMLQVTSEGVRLEGQSEFLSPIYAQEIHSREGSSLHVRSSRNVTLSSRNGRGEVTGRLTVGQNVVEAHGQRFEVRSTYGQLLFSAEKTEGVVGAERLRVTGAEGALFEQSLETPMVEAEESRDLRLESPTRSLSLDAPKSVHITALSGSLQATSNTDIMLHTTDGMLILDAETVKLPQLPGGRREGGAGGDGELYEVCACPDGSLYVSKAGPHSVCEGNGQGC